MPTTFQASVAYSSQLFGALEQREGCQNPSSARNPSFDTLQAVAFPIKDDRSGRSSTRRTRETDAR
jgi:hypothetical protein